LNSCINDEDQLGNMKGIRERKYEKS